MTDFYLESMMAAVMLALLISQLIRRKEGRAADKYFLALLGCLILLLTASGISRGPAGIPQGLRKAALPASHVFFYTGLGLYATYLSQFIGFRTVSGKKQMRFIYVMCGLGMALWVASTCDGTIAAVFGPRAGALLPGRLYWLGQICSLLIAVAQYYMVWEHSELITAKDLRRLMIYISIPLACFALRSITGITWLVPIGLGFTVFLTFLGLFTDDSLHFIEQERELAQYRNAVSLSQIKPHFMYNVLNSIYYLCELDPHRAQEITGMFTDYLRNNLDSMGLTVAVPFHREMDTVRTYLALEETRYGKRLKVEYDLTEEGFKVPSLSVQPLAENAVRHGISKKVDGGLLKISSRKAGEWYEVSIEDDGLGFDPADPSTKGSGRIGIENVRERLRIMCHGTLEITSAPGQGTRVLIRIPDTLENRLTD